MDESISSEKNYFPSPVPSFDVIAELYFDLFVDFFKFRVKETLGVDITNAVLKFWQNVAKNGFRVDYVMMRKSFMKLIGILVLFFAII